MSTQIRTLYHMLHDWSRHSVVKRCHKHVVNERRNQVSQQKVQEEEPGIHSVAYSKIL